MLHTSKLRSRGRNGFTPRLKPCLAALALIILLPLMASAYTVVLRNGRSMEIPATFQLTRAGITYEYAPGLYVTIQMSSIDIAATERANKEPQGSFLSRAGGAATQQGRAQVSSPANRAAAVQTRTLTDKELAEARLRRETSEAIYERRRVELGLPSLAETRRQREEEARRLSEMAEQARANESEAESYWRARASELRTAIAVNEAEIDYVRSELNETDTNYPFVGLSSVTGALAIYTPNGLGRFNKPGFPGTPGMPPTTPRRRPPVREPLTGRIGFGGGAAGGQILLNPRGPYRGGAWPRRRAFGARGISVWPLPLYAPYSYDSSYERSVLMARLHELEAERSGLQARWRLLEDEARRAGAHPGWLRP